MTNLMKGGFRQKFKGQLMLDNEFQWDRLLLKKEFENVKALVQRALDEYAFVELYGSIREDRFLAHITGGRGLGRIDGKLVMAGLEAGLELREVGSSARAYAEGQAFVTFRLGY